MCVGGGTKCTIMIHSFQTDRSGQTLLEGQVGEGGGGGGGGVRVDVNEEFKFL